MHEVRFSCQHFKYRRGWSCVQEATQTPVFNANSSEINRRHIQLRQTCTVPRADCGRIQPPTTRFLALVASGKWIIWEFDLSISLKIVRPPRFCTSFQFVVFVYVTATRSPLLLLIRPPLGHLLEDVYPGSKYVRGNIILVLPYLSSVWSINTSIGRWGW